MIRVLERFIRSVQCMGRPNQARVADLLLHRMAIGAFISQWLLLPKNLRTLVPPILLRCTLYVYCCALVDPPSTHRVVVFRRTFMVYVLKRLVNCMSRLPAPQ